MRWYSIGINGEFELGQLIRWTVGIALPQLAWAGGSAPPTAPSLVELDIAPAGSLLLNPADFPVADDVDPPADLQWFLTEAPEGELSVNGALLEGGEVFLHAELLSGNVRYTHLGTGADDSFSLQLTDSDGGTASETVVDITAVGEEVPDLVVRDDGPFEALEDQDLVLLAEEGVLANDDGATTAIVDEEPVNGTLTLGVDGSFTYTPAANFNGADFFTYTGSNGDESLSGTVDITVIALPDSPVLTDDDYALVERQVVVDAAEGCLANDEDVDGGTLSVVVGSEPVFGTVSLDEDGAFTYTVNAGFPGTDRFQYVATSSGGTDAEAWVTVTGEPIDPNNPNEHPVGFVDDQGLLCGHVSDTGAWFALGVVLIGVRRRRR